MAKCISRAIASSAWGKGQGKRKKERVDRRNERVWTTDTETRRTKTKVSLRAGCALHVQEVRGAWREQKEGKASLADYAWSERETKQTNTLNKKKDEPTSFGVGYKEKHGIQEESDLGCFV